MKNLFKKKANHIVISGISADDWVDIHSKLNAEYTAAHVRQKHPDSEPTQYMKGLLFAMAALESVRPYDLAEVVK